jgi:glycosyltransferase involved in cell wall biosynthesis
VRVLFVNANRSPAYGGVERWMIDAAVGLAGRGDETVLLGRPGTPWLAAARRAGVRVRGDIHGTWAQRVLRVRAAVCAERPDVVVVKGKKAARMAAWARSTGGGGRVVLFFGLTHELDPARWVDRFTWRHVDAGIVVAHGAAQWYAENGFGPPSKLHVLWKGVDLAAFDAARGEPATLRAALGLSSTDLAVGMVGRLAWQKGIDDLLAAVRLVRARVPQARFLVVGGGRDAAAIEAAVADPELAGAVRLLGQRDDVPALLAAMDVVVQSSRREVMAQTTLEAMAAGRPVVSTRTMGADEAIEDGASGVLVPVGAPGALAEAIVRLAADPGRRTALGGSARARIERHFTQRDMLDRCGAILARVVAGRMSQTGLPSDTRLM